MPFTQCLPAHDRSADWLSSVQKNCKHSRFASSLSDHDLAAMANVTATQQTWSLCERVRIRNSCFLSPSRRSNGTSDTTTRAYYTCTCHFEEVESFLRSPSVLHIARYSVQYINRQRHASTRVVNEGNTGDLCPYLPTSKTPLLRESCAHELSLPLSIWASEPFFFVQLRLPWTSHAVISQHIGS